MKVSNYILDFIFILTLISLAFVPKHKKPIFLGVFCVILFLNILIRIYFIVEKRKLEKRLQQTTEMAAPPTLSFLSKKIEKADSVYIVRLKFQPSKNQPLGQFAFAAKVIDDSWAKIIDFWPICGPPFTSGKDSKKISSDGKQARLIYQLMAVGCPEVELKVSDLCKVEITGSHDLKPFTLDIAQELQNNKNNK